MSTSDTASPWHGELRVQIVEPRKESPRSTHVPEEEVPSTSGRSNTFVSYGVRAETTLPHFASSYMVTRKRFQDFVFLRNALIKDFPACVVPPLPDKHRMGYLTGERFSPEFIQRRSMELQLFLERVCRHPVLQRAQILQHFLESSEWHIDMHKRTGDAIVSTSVSETSLPPSVPHGLLDSMGDMLVNAFTRVRKPDPKSSEIQAALQSEEETIGHLERLLLRNRTHTSVAAFDELYATHIGASSEDLSTDYRDLSTSLEQLAVLESGMAKALQGTAHALSEFAELETRFTTRATDDFLTYLHARHGFVQTHKALLKQQDAKQLDFEGLTDYLHAAITERERLAGLGANAGTPAFGTVRGTGLRGYMRSAVDRVWGVDEEQARIERMERLDDRIAELRDAVTTSHKHAQAFGSHVEQEHHIFDLGRRREVAHMLTTYIDGHMEMYEQGISIWDDLIATLETAPAAPSSAGQEADDSRGSSTIPL